jgi:hypothetical protein
VSFSGLIWQRSLNIENYQNLLKIWRIRVTDHPQSGWLGFFRLGGKIQRNGSALIGAGRTGCKATGLKTPNQISIFHQRPLLPYISNNILDLSLFMQMPIIIASCVSKGDLRLLEAHRAGS